MKKLFFTLFALLILNTSLKAQQENNMNEKVVKTKKEWKKILTAQEYHVLRNKGTDRPGNFGYTNHFEKGTYHCAACNSQLFASNSKFKSDCGWPSFDDALPGSIIFTTDKSLGMLRTEITCKKCDGHLGHIFDDGPIETTGKRYCVNTTSITFVKSSDEK